MAYFNPNTIAFNPSTNMIDAVGAVGRSFYEIYKDNVAKNQNQIKLDELSRHNAEYENLLSNKNTETFRHNLVAEDLSQKHNQAQNDLAKKRFNLEEQRLMADTAYKNAIIKNQRDRLGFDIQKYLSPKQNKEDTLYTQIAFNQLGEALPDELKNSSPEQILEYKRAIVRARTDDRLNKATQEANNEEAILKNLPVGLQKSISDSRALLDMLIPYTKDLSENESQISGLIDNITAPIAKALGLNSNALANLYADREAIAERIRAQTKNGGSASKKAALESLDPVNIQFDKTVANVGSLLKNHLSTLKQAQEMFKAQGNYKGAQILENQFNDYLFALAPEFRNKIMKDFNINKQNLPQNPNIKRFGSRQSAKNQDDLEQILDEIGAPYYGSDPLMQEF